MIIHHNKISPKICTLLIKKFDELNEKKIISLSTDDDLRIFGFEKVLSEDIVNFFYDIDNKASMKFFKKKPIFQTLMINKTFKTEGKPNLGSGGGWHRDSYFKKQMKTIFYLTKVDIKNGPFAYLEPKSKILNRYFPIKTRLNENIDEKLRFCSNKKLIISEKPGSGFSIITNYIHRGIPVKKGVRYALTVYSSLHDEMKFLEKLKI